MNKKLLTGLCCCLAFLFTTRSYAQSLPSVSGVITDYHKKPAAAVPVVLMYVKDSSTVATVLSGENGRFSFEQVKAGEYRVVINAVGFKKYIGTAITVDRQNIVLAPIQLEAATAELAGVTVTSTGKPFTEQKIDRTVVNVDALISNAGSNALEVLEKTPGVLVDENGGITLKGKPGVLVLIDDKPTYLSAADLATYLRSLPASQLEKIELMDNPPAKYDAAGNAGVINIRTKKSKTKGFNGSLAANYIQSFYARHNESLTLNYYAGKINLFASFGYNLNKNARLLSVHRDYFDASGSALSSFRQENYFTSVYKNPNAKIGFDYMVSPKTTWGIVYTGSANTSTELRPTFSWLYNKTQALDSSIRADNHNNGDFKKNGVNLNYTHKYDSTGRTISFDIDYINYRSNSEQHFSNVTYSGTGALKNTQDILALVPSNISIYAAKTDYSQPLANKAKFEAGLKTSFVTSDNEANYFNIIGGVSTVDYNNTNHFIYKENINAGYVNFSKEFKRVTVQAGLRLENTNGNGHQLGNLYKPDSAFTKHYTNLFPTAYLSYKLDSAGNDLLNFAYGRRIDRPNYQNLNPFVFMLDKFTAFAGNPFLKPQYASDFKLSYTHKNKFTLSGQYIHMSDIQIETIEQSGSVLFSRTGNIGQWNYLVLSLETTLKPAPWWSFNIYADLLNYQKYNGNLYTGYIETETIYTFLQGTNQFTLGKGWSAELGGFYCSPRKQSQFDKIPFGQLNAAFQKKLLNNKATIKLSLRDIFNTNVSAGNITNVPNATLQFRNNFYNPVAVIGFTYSFGTQGKTEEKRKVGSADSEAGRAGN